MTVRDLIKSIDGLIATFSSWRDDVPSEDFRDVGYGDFEPARSWEDEPDTELYFLPALLSGSDYSGCSVTRTNFEEFSRMAEEKGLAVWEAHGGHGTYSLVIRFDVTDEDFLEALAGLSDYPVIHDEALTRKEMELQDEAWCDCYEKDYVRALEKARSIEFDRYDADTLREVFERTREEINEYWTIETGCSAYVDVEKVANATDITELQPTRWTVDDPTADVPKLPPCPLCWREKDYENRDSDRIVCGCCRRVYELRCVSEGRQS